MIEPPKDTPEYAHGMWASALLTAAQTPQMIQAFKESTGISYELPNTKLEAMIDEATGRESEFAHAFGKWFNEHVWGPWDGDEI